MEKTKENNKKILIMTIFFAIFIAIFSFALTPIEFQNDTFYTIKIGEKIASDGIDMRDPFSWHENLAYTYPHWLYDFLTFKVYSLGGFIGVYIATGIMSSILGITLFLCYKKTSNSTLLSFGVSMLTMFLLRGFIAARAQLVTFILFALEYVIIEKFLENKKIINVILLFLISLLIANIHVAVWPFFFILFLPNIGAQIWIWLKRKLYVDNSIVKAYDREITKLKKKNRDSEKILELSKKRDLEIVNRNEREKFYDLKLNNPYKILLEKNKNAILLVPIMLLCLIAGFLTPLGPNTTFTYLIRTVVGNTTQAISEHLPIVPINRPTFIIFTVLLTWLLFFNNIKIKLSDFFLMLGLLLLTLISGRQESMFILMGSFVFLRLLCNFIKSQETAPNIDNLIIKSKMSYLYIAIFILLIILPTSAKNLDSSFVNEELYPVDAAKYIKENLDVNNIRLFNEYNYGSYLLMNDIPVFIDSRADLYAPEFNPGCTVFDDFISTSSVDIYPEETFEKYNITHIILENNGAINTIVSGSHDYNVLYTDDYFTIYERI